MTLSHHDDHLDRLGEMFEMQGDLQRNAYGAHPADMPTTKDKTQFVKDMVLALEDELHEALFEVSWKPWAKGEHFRKEAFRSELIDAWHFFMNLCLVADMTPEMLYQEYMKKHKKNAQRQAEGYDAQSTKCPKCTRAYDDEFVNCTPGNCEVNGEYPTAA